MTYDYGMATTDASGVVQERMKYDAFGQVAWMNASFGTLANSAYAWNRTYTGQVLDNETELMLYRNRYYRRFVSRDPIGYEVGDVSLYRYVRNRIAMLSDPSGLLPPWQLPQGPVYGPLPQSPPTPSPPTQPTPTPHGCTLMADGSVRCGPRPNLPPPPAANSCCNGVKYDPETQCCEDNQIVGKVSIWVCNRHIPYTYPVSRLGIPGSRSLQLNHSYVCCDGENKNCYGNQWGNKKGQVIPKEDENVQGKCEEKQVCPAVKTKKCESPVSSCDYWLPTYNCHTWAWEGVE